MLEYNCMTVQRYLVCFVIHESAHTLIAILNLSNGEQNFGIRQKKLPL